MKDSDKTITSVSNPRVKHLIGLRKRRNREAHGQILIEGATEVARALAADVSFEELWVCHQHIRPPEGAAAIPTAQARDVPVVEVSERVFDKLAYREGSAGIIGVAHAPATDFDTLAIDSPTLVVVAVGLEKPGNLGAVFRTADAAGADAIIIVEGGTDLWNPNTIRASLGTVFCLPAATATPPEALAWLHGRRLRLIATVPEADHDYTEVDLRPPTAIVLGPEADGLPSVWREAAVQAVRVPMLGAADSLNVSATAAIVLFEARRQRG